MFIRKTVFLLSVFVGLLLSAADGNLVQNGDFESGQLAPWKSAQAGNTLHQVIGKHLNITGDPANKYNKFITLVQPLPVLDSKKEYLLSARARAEVAQVNGKRMEICVREADAQNQTIDYRKFVVDLQEKDWMPYSLFFKPNAEAKSFALYVVTSGFAAEDTLKVDDIFLGFAPEIKGDETNLVVNGEFESPSLLPWECSQQSSGRRLHRLSGNTRFDKQCLSVSGDPENKYNQFIALVQPLPPLKPDGTYVLSARVRAGLANIKDKSFQINLREANAQGNSLQYVGFSVNLSDDVWKYYEKTIKPHKNAAQWQVYITSSGLDAEDEVLVDNVRFELEGSAARPFDPEASVAPAGAVKTLAQDAFVAEIDEGTGMLHSLKIQGRLIQPAAKNASVIAIESNGKELFLNGKGGGDDCGFSAEAVYDFADGMFREIVTVEAKQDFEDVVKIVVRHGFDPSQWSRHIDALRPLRLLPAGEPTIFSYSTEENDLNPDVWDTYQATAYPAIILESPEYYLLVGSRNLDDFVTLAPNYPANYLPSWQRNPKSVKTGQQFRFETNWKLFDRNEYMLRDVWRFYQLHLQTKNPVLARFFPPIYPEPRHFYHGIFGSHTYMVKEREDRLPDGANVWFYSMHDNIRERFHTEGEWWSHGNSWAKKVNAVELKEYMARLQSERDFKLIMYLRQLANLREREAGAFPDDWYKRTPGGSLHLYGGGYSLTLPPHVAKDVGYDSIPWGQHNFGHPDYRAFYLKEIFKAMDYYQPRAIGWDMGSDLDEFSVMAETYDRLRKAGHKIRVVANESAGPTQAYADMVMLENGLMGGKHPEDFEIVKAFTTAVVCLERWNIFQLAYEAYTTGRKTWLSDYGLASNKRYLDLLYARRPELKTEKEESARLCQLRASLYDLALGASPGYMEEAAPVPPSLLRIAADANGLFCVNKSFALTFPNNNCEENGKYFAAWQNPQNLRLAAFNDNASDETAILRLDKAFFASLGWNLAALKQAQVFQVSPEGEEIVSLDMSEDGKYFLIKGKMPAFTAWLFFVVK